MQIIPRHYWNRVNLYCGQSQSKNLSFLGSRGIWSLLGAVAVAPEEREWQAGAGGAEQEGTGDGKRWENSKELEMLQSQNSSA